MSHELFPVAILAGGLATRLHPATQVLPKALIKVRNEPFVFHQLRLLQKQGIKKIILCIGYLGEQIQDEVGDGSQFDLSVSYSLDGAELRGTAGAIRHALPLLGENFFVMYGDSWLTCDYAAVQKAYTQSGRAALMTVFRNVGQWDRSNVVFSGDEIQVYDKTQQTEKMDYIDYGLGVFSAAAFRLPESRDMADLAELYALMLRIKKLAGYEVKERFYEIGSFTGIAELDHYLGEADGIRETVFD